MLVHQRRAGLARFQHIVDRRQLVEVERHRGRDILGLRARRRHAHGDEFTDLAHFSNSKHRLLGDLEPRQTGHRADRLDAGEIARDKHRTAKFVRHMDAADARMRQRAAHERHVLQAGQADVGDELAAPAHQAVVLLARQPRADALPGFELFPPPLWGRAREGGGNRFSACGTPLPAPPPQGGREQVSITPA